MPLTCWSFRTSNVFTTSSRRLKFSAATTTKASFSTVETTRG